MDGFPITEQPIEDDLPEPVGVRPFGKLYDDAPETSDDPAIHALRNAELAECVYYDLDATAEKERPDTFEAVQHNLNEAERVFAATPVHSLAGAFVKLRYIINEVFVIGAGEDDHGAAARTVLAYLQHPPPVSPVSADTRFLDSRLGTISLGLWDGPTDTLDPTLAAWRATEAAELAFEAAPGDTPEDDERRQQMGIDEQLDNTEKALAAAPVTSAVGAIVKLRYLARRIWADENPPKNMTGNTYRAFVEADPSLATPFMTVLAYLEAEAARSRPSDGL